LNLTAANRIHLLEPQWNPSVEEQAVGRAVRLGQEREVTMIRYVMTQTVEEVCDPFIPRHFADSAEHPCDSEEQAAASELDFGEQLKRVFIWTNRGESKPMTIFLSF
jgi:hypothetical protein